MSRRSHHFKHLFLGIYRPLNSPKSTEAAEAHWSITTQPTAIMIDTEFWFDIGRVVLFGAFSLAVSWAMVFAAFCLSKLAWADFQRCYSDVKELNSLRLLSSELAKRDASLAKAEERVKELEAELAEPKHENQAASSPEIKYRFDPIKVPKEQNWFSEQWAMYSYIRNVIGAHQIPKSICRGCRTSMKQIYRKPMKSPLRHKSKMCASVWQRRR